MRPAAATEKPLVLGHQQPHSPLSQSSTPGSATGGGALRVGAFGPPPGALGGHGYAPDAVASPHGGGHRRGGGRDSASHAQAPAASPAARRSAVALGGGNKGTHADGRPREWDESSDDDD
jgi:hypothetical protein